LLELATQLQAALSAGQTVVVPTAQRAAVLRLAFATQQLAHGQRAFRTPDVQSLSGWLHGQPVRSVPDAPPLRRLGVSEEWLLWREAVAAAAANLSLPAAGLVDAVRESAALLFEWRIAPAAVLQAGTRAPGACCGTWPRSRRVALRHLPVSHFRRRRCAR
jgi:hypothetical protein